MHELGSDYSHKGDSIMRASAPFCVLVRIGLLVAAICLGVATCLAAPTADAVMPYTVTDLGVEDLRYMFPGTVNDSAQVVGTCHLPYDHAFLWEDGAVIDLGTLGGDSSYGFGINNLGQVVGRAGVQPPAAGDHAFLWLPAAAYGLPAGMNDLGTPEGCASTVQAINDNGQVVGSMTNPGGAHHAFLWEAGVMTNIGSSIPYQSFALGINNLGQVVGHTWSPDWGFLWDPDDGVTWLGDGCAVAINDLGQVAGYGGRKAFIWQDGVRTDLGTLGGTGQWAGDINNAGQIVGAAATASMPLGQGHAFIWEDGIMYDLNDLVPSGSGWEFTGAYAINEAGQILVEGVNPDEYYNRAFLLTPIPEPATLMLVAFLASSLWAARSLKYRLQRNRY